MVDVRKYFTEAGATLPEEDIVAMQAITAEESQTEPEGPTPEVPFRYTEQALNPRAEAVRGIAQRDPRARSPYAGGIPGGIMSDEDFMASLADQLGLSKKEATEAISPKFSGGLFSRDRFADEYLQQLGKISAKVKPYVGAEGPLSKGRADGYYIPSGRMSRFEQEQMEKYLNSPLAGMAGTPINLWNVPESRALEASRTYQDVRDAAQEAIASDPRGHLGISTDPTTIAMSRVGDSGGGGGIYQSWRAQIEPEQGMYRLFDKLGPEATRQLLQDPKFKNPWAQLGLSQIGQSLRARIPQKDGKPWTGELLRRAKNIGEPPEPRGGIGGIIGSAIKTIIPAAITGIASFFGGPIVGAIVGGATGGLQTGFRDPKAALMGAASGAIGGLGANYFGGARGLGLLGTNPTFAGAETVARALGAQGGLTGPFSAIAQSPESISGGMASGLSGITNPTLRHVAETQIAQAAQIGTQSGAAGTQSLFGLDESGSIFDKAKAVVTSPGGRAVGQVGQTAMKGVKNAMEEQAMVEQAKSAVEAQARSAGQGLAAGPGMRQGTSIFQQKLPDNPYYDPNEYIGLGGVQEEFI